ncbi:peptidoglycan DD-metalloendopeptidase family protein [Laspinema sp. A4]|uniref:peptidoglycan DD-metalloendopeptidase family protein n=1 Tax=Laspinema sp. D2d TaxID=2953686 RepID=UPI0021BAA6B3|nr:peptidoglycan DD-metalloendopeptidase family protein [Laspinema sp. D2d]MCT7985877.1 peptidoglycan DD-metalloendopeptidase family protein [Laspinema sp. D2d]
MKRAFPQKVKPVPSCAADSNRTVAEIRQVLAGPRKVRTSAAMIGLAISMGASSILLPQQGEGAGASEPPIAADTSATDPGSWSTLEAEAASTDEAGTQIAEQTTVDPSAVEPQVQEEATPWTLTEQGPVPSQMASNPGDRGQAEGTGEVNLTLPYPQELAREGNPAGASFSWQIDEIRSDSGVSSAGVVQSDEPTLDPSLAEWWGEESVSSVVESSLGMSQESDGPGPEMAPSGLVPQVEGQESTEGTVVNSLSLEGRTSEPLLGGIRPEGEATPSQVNSQRTSPGWQSYLEENSTGNAQEISQPATAEVNAGETSGFVPLVTPEQETRQEEALQPELSSFPESENDDPTALNLAEPDMNGAIAIPAVESASATRIYQVSFGDTLDAIALRNGVSAEKIAEANSLNDPDLLEVNQTIKIPLSSTESGPNSIAGDLSHLNREEARDLSASAKSDVVALPKSVTTDTTFALIAPNKPSEAIASIPETAVSVIERTPESASDLMTGDRSVSEEMRSASSTATLIAQAAPSVETEANESDHIDGLRADILKLRQKYREQEALGQHSQIEAVETTSQPQDETSVAENSPRVEPQLSAQADEGSSFTESIQAHGIEPELLETRYVDSLRAEIEKLREKYKTENLSLEASGESVPATLPNTLAVRTTSTAPAGPSERINPQFNPQPNETLENAPRAQESQREEILAVAPVGSETYAPLMQPAVGQIVSPELPPLKAPDTYLPDSQPTFNGFIWPAHGVFTSGYGWRWGRMHKGIDIAGPTGTPIYAAATGVVITAGWNSGGYGNLVEIEHPDGSVTLYAHNHRIMVQEGQQVEQGQQVAEMGSTGFSTGPHLHFEIHASGQGAVNPMALLPPE